MVYTDSAEGAPENELKWVIASSSTNTRVSYVDFLEVAGWGGA